MYCFLGLHLYSYSGECIFDIPSPSKYFEKGVIEVECTIPGNFLNDGAYYISMVVVKDTSVPLFLFEECMSFDLEDYRGDIQWYGKWVGAVRPNFPFRMEQIEYTLE